MAASLFALAKVRGFQNVDHVLLSTQGTETRAGEEVFIVQGDLQHPGKLRAQMPTADAVATSPAQSFERAAAPAQALQLQQQESIHQDQQRAPVLAR